MRSIRQHGRTFPRSSLSLLVLVIGPPPAGPGPARAEEYPTIGTIERLDARLDRILAPDARMERLAEGFDWSEGPAWVRDRDGGYLVFSDVPRNTVFRW